MAPYFTRSSTAPSFVLSTVATPVSEFCATALPVSSTTRQRRTPTNGSSGTAGTVP